MVVSLDITFEDSKEFQDFLIVNSDFICMKKISGKAIASLSDDFIMRFIGDINIHRLFIESIKKGNISKINFCLENGVNYSDKESIKESKIGSLNSSSPIGVAFEYGKTYVVDYFLDEKILSLEEIHRFILSLISKLKVGCKDRKESIRIMNLIRDMFNRYDVDVNYAGGMFMSIAVESKFSVVLELMKFLIEKGANIEYLNILYVKGNTYFPGVLEYVNELMDEINQIDITFFTTGKFSDNKH